MKSIYAVGAVLAIIGALPALIFGFSMSIETNSLWWIPIPAAVCCIAAGVLAHMAEITQ